MASVHLLPPIHSMLHRTSGWRTHLFSVAAGSIAVLILAANLLMLPIPYLGIEIHPQTHAVLSVAPGSSGERAGVRIGDMVVRLYDRPIADVFSSLTFVGWIPPRDQPIPIMVERNGQSIMFHLAQDPPVLNSRLFMGAMAVLAILCWITGYVLGVGRSQSVLEAQLAAYFWISIAGVVGTIQFALAASLPLLVMIAWVVAGMLVPLNVYMHVFFPPRMADVVSKQRVKRFVVGMCIITNGFILGVIMVKHSLISVLLALLAVVPVALVIGFSSSAVLLHRAYRTTTVAHTRRQIRLIAAASGIIACAWVLLYILPSLLLGVRLVPRNVLFGICGLVPLAYLVSIGTRDLYRIDRLAARCLVHAATITVLGTLLFIIAAQLQLWGTAASTLLALSFVVLYRPAQHIVARALPSKYVLHQYHAALDDTISKLARTLDTNHLVTILAEGMRAAFSQPALAVYTGNIHGSNELHLHTSDRFADLPTTVTAGTLTALLHQFKRPVNSRRLYHDVDTTTLTENEYQLVAQPGIAVWMPIHHSQGHLLGVVLLGMRGDLDPYRTEDMVALQRVLSAASLAFTNSAAFAQQQEAEAMIRQLYRRLQTTQDTMTRELAHELHDEIINVHVRLNILSLADVRHHVANQEALGEIDTVLESLHTMSDDLRSMCEQLYPTGLDDPFGLGAVLRTQLRKEQARWNGECRFEETGQPVPITAQVQREALRITKEAVTNAIKHADAHTIVVHLAYPDAPHTNIQLSITDDGVGTGRLAERAGHFGLRYMRESAGAAGGTLRIDAQPAGGTRIVFMFPAPGSAHHTIGVFQGDDHATA